jgi:hypothetical protein
MFLKLILSILLAGLFNPLYSQLQNNPVILAEFSYGAGFPMADLKTRFGTQLNVAAGLSYQPSHSHFRLGVRFNYFFGSEVKEDVLAPFRTDFGGLIIGSDQFLAEMKLKERGFVAQFYSGGLLPVFSQDNARQSISWQLGFGFIQHYIRFVDDARALTQFNTNYLKGLDRLSNGFALIPFIGYEYLSRKGWLSFYGGIETVIGFTENRRSLNYDTNMSELDIPRTDIMLNAKIGLYLPFYIITSPESIEY